MWRAFGLLLAALIATGASAAERETALTLAPTDVIPTGNDWIALPSIRAGDAALMDFNVISMRYRGLIEFAGPVGQPLMKPFLSVNGVTRPLANLRWSLRDYWLPTGTMEADGVRTQITFVAPPESRAAIIRFQVTNLGSAPIKIAPGMEVNWARTNRVTYSPALLKGARAMSPTPIDTDMEIFSYKTDDTQFAWGFAYVGSKGVLKEGADPGVTAQHEATLAPGATLDVHYLIGVGLEEYSAAYAMRVLNKRIDRYGIAGVIDQAAADAQRRVRSTGNATLDWIMNRNMLFTTYYAWGRSLDTEEFIGVTSRSNRYYVSAAYWDRDALLWSFPALLDTDPARAREALGYALGIQARNAGIHSRFIDGAVLEDGLELDELVAPLVALNSYVVATRDRSVLDTYAEQIATIKARTFALRDPAIGLYETFQDAQDEYVRKPFSIYDNVLTWRALNDLALLSRGVDAADLRSRAKSLKTAIMRYGVRDGVPGAGGPIFAATVSATEADFMDVPPGSLLKLPYLGFIAEDDPLFVRTYKWLHSANYPYSYADKPWGLPGSYRLPFTTSWSVADHLRLRAGQKQALKVLTDSAWDGGIISEGVKPETGQPDQAGLAFATAAGYVGHTICAQFCTDRPKER